jgi:diaminopimelate decarboxylase
MALVRGVRRFSVESWHDLEMLSRAARSTGTKARALLRVNPAEAPRAKLAMTGVASQFGFEEEDLRDGGAERLVEAAGPVAVEGVHIYWGTQIGGPEALLECFRAAVLAAERISADLGFPLRVLNLGGGFPWPYASRGRGPDLEPLRAGLAALRAGAGAAREAEWWFESGRFLAASSGTLVARVMDVKRSKDKRFLLLDTGIHHLGGMTGLGRIPRFSIDFDTEPCGFGEAAGAEFEVVGPLCTPLDCLAKRTVLPELRPGDLVSVPNVGAYGVTGSLVAFLSRPAPAEILHRGRRILAAHRLRGGHELLSPNPGSRRNPAPTCHP